MQRLLGGQRRGRVWGGVVRTLRSRGWRRQLVLEYSDTSSPGGLDGGRGLPCACLGPRPSRAHGAHRLVGATLGCSRGLPSWAPRPPGLGKVRSPVAITLGPAEPHTSSRSASGPRSRPSCSARPRGNHITGKAGIPRAVGLLGHSPGLILLMPVSRAGLQPCQSLCPLSVTPRGGGPEGEGAGSLSPHHFLLPAMLSADHPSLLSPLRSPVQSWGHHDKD